MYVSDMNVFYYNFCLSEIRYHVNKINEIIPGGLGNPRESYDRQMAFREDLRRTIPLPHEQPPEENSAVEENLQDTHHEDSEVSSNFALGTPSHPLSSSPFSIQ